MNFDEIKRSFSRYLHQADEMGLTWLLVLAVILVVVWVLMSGKKINFRIPFLPRSMNKISVSKDDLTSIAGGVKNNLPMASGNTGNANKTQTSGAGGLSADDIPTSGKNSFWELLSGANEERYQQPTYLLLSGAYSLEKQANDVKPDAKMLDEFKMLLGQKERKLEKRFGGGRDNWYCYDQGIVVHGASLDRAITELQQYRPERPVDGLIITLPASKLLSGDMLALENWANEIYKDIWETQKRLGFILPIHLLVTEAEQIEGFNDFWQQEQLQTKLDEQFGWANHYGVAESFQSVWIDEAFHLLTQHVRAIQLAIIHQDSSVKVKDSARDSTRAMLFASQLDQLRASVSKFCNELFNHNVLQNPLVFAGINFTSRRSVESENAPVFHHHMFIKDWLERRVFKDNDKAFAPRSRLLSSNAKLRTYQYATLAAFVTLLGILLIDAIHLKQQTQNLEQAISGEPSRQSGQEIQYIHDLIHHISKMDAGEINYLSMPMSWNTPFNEKLVQYFSAHTFDERLFPEMECKMEQELRRKFQDMENKTNASDFANWLDSIAENFVKQRELQHLIYSDINRSDVMLLLESQIDYLYNDSLPGSFYSNSELYVQAISQQHLHLDSRCDPEALASLSKWNEITRQAEQEIIVIQKSIQKPQAFFNISEQMASLPTVVSWYNSIPELSQPLQDFNNWLQRIQQRWIVGHTQPNSCEQITTALTHLTNTVFTTPTMREYPDKFLNMCVAAVENSLVNDNARSPFKLYVHEDVPLEPTQDAIKLFEAVTDLNGLSYIYDTNIIQRDALKDDFYWSVEKLNRALSLHEEYETYAQAHYNSLWLPKKHDADSANYFAQSIALKQLQFAMNRLILQAQVESVPNFRPAHLRPVNQQEAFLAAEIGNFRKSMNSILALLAAFKKLEFNESYQWLLNLSQSHAFRLLQKVDSLYAANRIYTPLENPRWVAHQYNAALFGIKTEAQLNDYVVAQNERASTIANEYAEPLVVFLMNTQGEYINFDLFGRWKNSLIELNKYLSNDPTNHLAAVGDFLNSELSGVDQSNCFETTKSLSLVAGNDIFAIQQRNIVERATAHCDSYRADIIRDQYSEVRTLYLDYLAGKYPFSASPQARDVSPRDIQHFLDGWDNAAKGLAERFAVLAWKEKRNVPALKFIQQMDKVATFFRNTLAVSQGQGATGLEVQIDFNALENSARFVSHLSSWELAVGAEQSAYPALAKKLFWLPGDNISLNLNWAEQSPYKAFAINGSSRLQNVLSYDASGTWSLLRFMSNNAKGVSITDTEALSENARLLSFKANVLPKDALSPAPQQNQLRAFLRLTVYGVDEATGKQGPLAIPQFPASVPELY